MKTCLISILCFLAIFSALAQAEILFWDNFEDGAISKGWKINNGDITEKDGVLTMTQGAKQYPDIVTKDAFDFGDGVTFQGDMKLGNTSADMVMCVGPTDASELAPFPIPWFGPFVRIVLDQTRPYVQSTPKGNGADVTKLADFDQVDPGKAHQWAMYLKKDAIKVYVDKKKVLDTKHTGGFTKGYFTFGAGEELVKDTTVDNVVIYTGDYDVDVPSKAQAVNTAGKLSISWGAVKNQ